MPGFFKSLGQLFTGQPQKTKQVSTLLPEQQQLYQQLVGAGQGQGAGGAFGNAADYYRSNLSNNPADFNAFAAPALRQYNEEIVPGLSEQFAGMGAGGLSSSGFRNAQIQGATDLSERLGALRANLRQQSAQGLQGIGQAGLGNFSQQQVSQQGTEGLLGPALGAIGSSVGGPFFGALGGAAGNAGANWLRNSWGSENVGKNTSPTGQG